jgi:hypothetical protein
VRVSGGASAYVGASGINQRSIAKPLESFGSDCSWLSGNVVDNVLLSYVSGVAALPFVTGTVSSKPYRGRVSLAAYPTMMRRDRQRLGLRECRAAWLLRLTVREYRQLEAGEFTIVSSELWERMVKVFGWPRGRKGVFSGSKAGTTIWRP